MINYRFMEKYSALKNGKEPDLSDYKEFKLKEDNVGEYTLNVYHIVPYHDCAKNVSWKIY